MSKVFPAVTPPDIAELSRDWLAAVVFAKSTGQGSRVALSIARGAKSFLEFMTDDRKIGYFAGFDATEADAARLIVLMRHAHRWTGTTLFIRGRPVRWIWSTEQTLDCFIRSHAHDTPKEYCAAVHPWVRPSMSFEIRISVGPGLPPIAPEPTPMVRLPCKRLGIEQIRRTGTLSKLRSCVQTDAIDRDVYWCPRFDLSALKTFQDGDTDVLN